MKKNILLISLFFTVSCINGMDNTRTEIDPNINVEALIEPFPDRILDAMEHNKLVRCSICRKIVHPTDTIPHAFQNHLPIIQAMCGIPVQPKENVAECETVND